MKTKNKILSLLLFSGLTAHAQFHEVGIEGGTSAYFGDLNIASSFKPIKPAFGIFYRRNINPYFAWKTNLNGGVLEFDSKQSSNAYLQYQNLNFRDILGEATSVIEFNFFKYKSNKIKGCRWSPFVFLGVGMLYYKLQGNYDNSWIDLPSYNTEGKTYNTFLMTVPFGGGIKINIVKYITFELEAVYHHTYSDYLDDVSSTYTGKSIYVNGQPTNIADPSNINNPLSKTIGKQRGEQYKDKFLFSFLSISYTFHVPHCPNPDVNDGFEVFDK